MLFAANHFQLFHSKIRGYQQKGRPNSKKNTKQWQKREQIKHSLTCPSHCQNNQCITMPQPEWRASRNANGVQNDTTATQNIAGRSKKGINAKRTAQILVSSSSSFPTE